MNSFGRNSKSTEFDSWDDTSHNITNGECVSGLASYTLSVMYITHSYFVHIFCSIACILWLESSSVQTYEWNMFHARK
jgi:hypothetical protein